MMRRVAARAVAVALFVACAAALPARAALFDDDEARKRVEQTNQKLAQVQKQLEDRIAALELQLKNQGLVELFNTVEQMKADVAKLRGQIEVLVYEQEQSGKRQRDLYVDLDSRLRKLESGPVAAGGAMPEGNPGAAPIGGLSASGPGVPASAAEQRAYDTALDQFKGGSYAAAIGSFSSFVKTYPRSPLAPSAQYWIGNAQFAQKDFRGAIASQRQLLAAYPDSGKVPDALLNIASCQVELGDGAGSRRTLEDLVAKHPQSDAAAKARQRLAGR
ncbi:MAG: tol-pal system protein YbgF [Betaproteobacteria bacterium]